MHLQGDDAPSRAYCAWGWTGSADPQALELSEINTAPLDPGFVLVRNAAIGLDPVDWKVLGGDLVNWQAGKGPGVHGAGVVVAVADDDARGWLGQRVAYHTSLTRRGASRTTRQLRRVR
ncbi:MULTISPECIES: alcohol dehydrogenase catalytic domain-containing protein [Caballeronia]|uniref:alcohol dehydrogenase catalytic domain-containing protein n=1 Tax=Caballeronia TaxID=1827195 RepID=UPI003857595F